MSDFQQNQISAALQNMFDYGQMMFKQFLEQARTQQQGTESELASMPDAEAMSRMQQEYAKKHMALWATLIQRKPGELSDPVVKQAASDKRFKAPAWSESPLYDYLRQTYLLNAEAMEKLLASISLPEGRTKDRIEFMTHQLIDAMSPANFPALNPEFIKEAVETEGKSITRGIQNLLGDMEKGRISMTDEDAFEVGRNLGVTPGEVVYENDLIQLIQYKPATAKVHQVPLLIVPPCINKFYILDLQPENSFVKYVVSQGMSVFLISWKNVGEAESNLGWEDYLEKGVFAALDIVRDISKEKKPNVLGFCVGGTILASALAVLRGRGEEPVSSLTLLTVPLDFAVPGDLGCFIDEASIAAREATNSKKGLLHGQVLANIFSVLRPNDLIWQYVVGNYMKGNKPQPFDLLYWNADSTNLTAPFLNWYLRNMYLENNLRVPGKLKLLGVKVDLGKINVPAYFLASREDHIVPWKGAYLGRHLLGGDTTFVLGASGHIAGVINPPEKQKRHYWIADGMDVADPDEWFAAATEHPGSWWPHWIEWLKLRAGKEVNAPAKTGNAKYKPIEPAPGRYVKERPDA